MLAAMGKGRERGDGRWRPFWMISKYLISPVWNLKIEGAAVEGARLLH
jgi:hypothetical protein